MKLSSSSSSSTSSTSTPLPFVTTAGENPPETTDGSGNDKSHSGSTSEKDDIIHVKDIDPVDWKQCGMSLSCLAPSDDSVECVSFSSDGNIMAVGSPHSYVNDLSDGRVHVYERLECGWTQLGDDIVGSGECDYCGWSTSLSSDGRILAVGLPAKNNFCGCVRVYEFANHQWKQKGDDIMGKADGDWCGWSVSLSSDGAVVAIGSPYNSDNGFSSGHVRVYEHDTNGWAQRGNTLIGYRADDKCGSSVSLSSDGNVLAIGSPDNKNYGSRSGHVRVFEYETGIWSQIGSTIAGEDEDQCGYSVSLSSDGNVVAVGSPYFTGDYGYYSTGCVRVFERTNFNRWVQRGDDIVGRYKDSRCGRSVSLSSDGTVVAVGSPECSLDDKRRKCGLVEAFGFASGGWTKIGSDITGNAVNDRCGGIVSISSDGKMLVVGSLGDESNGHVRVYKL